MPQSKFVIVISLFILSMIVLAPLKSYSQLPSLLDSISQTTVAPYNEICFLRIKRKRIIGSSYFVSTGFFIAQNIVLTAAHNIHSTFNSNVTSIEIVPGKYFANQPNGKLVINGKDACESAIRTHSSYSFSDGWLTRIQWDFGIIIIPQKILARNLSLQNVPAFTLDSSFVVKVGDSLQVAGYPANKDAGYNGDFITAQFDTCSSVSNKTFRHRLETQRGNSGSPIWVEHKGKRIIVGVHTFSNMATKLDVENHAMLLKWLSTTQ